MNREERMQQLRIKGLSYQSIAKLFQISRQRVHQILSEIPTDGSLEKKTFKRLFEEIERRDNHQCQWGEKCKEKVREEDLLVHHIDFNNKNNDSNNLITLCKNCHLYFHSFNHIDKEVEKTLRRRNWRRVKIKCLNCGLIKDFPYHYKNKKFCDKKCRGQYKTKQYLKRAKKIYKLYKAGIHYKNLMEQFSVSQVNIHGAIRRVKLSTVKDLTNNFS